MTLQWLSIVVALSATASEAPEAAPADFGCAEIDPAALEAKVVDTSVIAGHATTCLPGTSDGRGYVALGTRNALGHPDMVWQVKTLSGGAPLGSFSGPNVTTLLPQEDGWIGGSDWGFPDDPTPPRISGWSSLGAPLHEAEVPADQLAPDFASGALLTYGKYAQRYASDATPRSAPVEVADGDVSVVAGGVNASRDTLVLFSGSTAGVPAGHLGGRWLDPCGAPKTAVFDTGLTAPLAVSSATLAPLYDGSLALNLDGQWTARFAPLSTNPAAPAPRWLAARPGTHLAWIRDGKGYALVPDGGADVPQCRQEVFLYARSGRACGHVTFAVDDQPCTTGEITVGPDGTVVQRSPRAQCLDSSCFQYRCSYTWWPQLLGPMREVQRATCGR